MSYFSNRTKTQHQNPMTTFYYLRTLQNFNQWEYIHSKGDDETKHENEITVAEFIKVKAMTFYEDNNPPKTAI